MDKYFFLMAQVPLLSFGIKTYMTKIRFLEEAAKACADEEAIERSDFMRSFRVYEDTLLEQARLIREGARAAWPYMGAHPLEVEKNLLRARWSFVENTSLNHFFDITAVAAYCAKLEILEKYFVFDKDKGVKNFDQICEAVL